MEIITTINSIQSSLAAYAQRERIHGEPQHSLDTVHDTVTISQSAQKRLWVQETGDIKGEIKGEVASEAAGEGVSANSTEPGISSPKDDSPAAAKDKSGESQSAGDEAIAETAKQIRNVKKSLDDAKQRLAEAMDKIDSKSVSEDESTSTQASESSAKASAKAAQSKLLSIAFFSEAMEVEAIKIEISQLSSQLMALYRSHRSTEQEGRDDTSPGAMSAEDSGASAEPGITIRPEASTMPRFSKGTS